MKRALLGGLVVVFLAGCASLTPTEQFFAYPSVDVIESPFAIVRPSSGVRWVSINGEVMSEEVSRRNGELPLALAEGTYTVVFDWSDSNGAFAEGVEQEISVIARGEYELVAFQDIVNPNELFVTFNQISGPRELQQGDD